MRAADAGAAGTTTPSTYPAGIDPLAIVGHAPEDRTWKVSDPAHQPLIHPRARVEAFATIDAGITRPTRVDEAAWIFKHAHVGHDAWVQAGAEVATGSIIGGHAVIESEARVGIGATILPYRTVGHHAHVGAGAVVVKDVAPYATVIGNPARLLPVEQRDPRPHDQRGQQRLQRTSPHETSATEPVTTRITLQLFPGVRADGVAMVLWRAICDGQPGRWRLTEGDDDLGSLASTDASPPIAPLSTASTCV